MINETELQTWATNIKAGEAARITAGGKPMSNPAAAGIQKEIFASELGAESNTFFMVYNHNETSEGGWEVVEGE